MDKKKWHVQIPIAGIGNFTVYAKNEESAIKSAMSADWDSYFSLKESELCLDMHVEELDLFEKIIEGNVCRLYVTKASADPIEEDED